MGVHFNPVRRPVRSIEQEAGNPGPRIRELKNLVFDTFVLKKGASHPEKHPSRRDIYDAARERIRELGRVGGPAYRRALTRVKSAWVSPTEYKTAVESILPKDMEVKTK